MQIYLFISYSHVSYKHCLQHAAPKSIIKATSASDSASVDSEPTSDNRLPPTVTGTHGNTNTDVLDVQPAPTVPVVQSSFSNQGTFPSIKPDGFPAVGAFTAGDPPPMQSCKWAEFNHLLLMLILQYQSCMISRMRWVHPSLGTK